jgi:hypothetical protein
MNKLKAKKAESGNNILKQSVRPNRSDMNVIDEDNGSLFSKKSFFFLVPPKQS